MELRFKGITEVQGTSNAAMKRKLYSLARKAEWPVMHITKGDTGILLDGVDSVKFAQKHLQVEINPADYQYKPGYLRNFSYNRAIKAKRRDVDTRLTIGLNNLIGSALLRLRGRDIMSVVNEFVRERRAEGARPFHAYG